MSSLHPTTGTIKCRIRNQKNLVYKGKKYAIDFDLLKHYSDTVYNHDEDYKNIDDINIPEELDDVNDNAITTFIRFIHNEHTNEDINDSNVFGIRQLCNHFEVPELKEYIENYISQNKNLVFQAVLLKFASNQGNQINSDDEKNISLHFFDFIDNKQMLKIPIPVMYRILNDYDLKINNLNERDSNRFINFLFNYLKNNGKSASVLFSTIDIQRSRIELIPTLLDKYSDIFDFNMINPELGIKTIRELLNEITKLKLNFSTKMEEINRNINKQIENYSNLSTQITNLTNLINQQINYQKSNETRFNQIDAKFNKEKDNYSNLSTQILNLTNLLNQQINCQKSNEARFNQIDAKFNSQKGTNQKIQYLETNLTQQNKTIQSIEISLKSKIDSLKMQIESSFNAKLTNYQSLYEQMNANVNSNKKELTSKIDKIIRAHSQNNNQSFITKDIRIYYYLIKFT